MNESTFSQPICKNISETSTSFLETTNSSFHKVNRTPDNVVAIIFCLSIAVIGVIGNVLVIGIKTWKYKSSTHQVFIIGLAITDVLVCGLVMPINSVEMLMEYSFYTTIIGRVIRTMDHMLVFMSIVIVSEMSIDQYRKICYPTKRQMTPNIAALIIKMTVPVALVFAIPVTFVRRVNIDKDFVNEGFFDCKINDEENPINIAYDVVLSIIYVAANFIIIGIYVKIGKTVFNQINFRINLAGKTFNKSIIVSKRRRNVLEASSRRIVKITFVISLVFLISHLPILVLYIHENINGSYLISPCSLYNPVIAVIERFYGFNHMANPFIYGFFDKKFRREISIMVTKICPCKKSNSK
ncbi:Hypothetical predicted protein [Mytilus galloprovincialis]|uniref:G-protein coupled receptors family 1 profile domain-containing protein n=1 Tax=Mytilus galloprovincialis TaxID=29158 RepID=A0A8B6E926_MYTGA|nr:Hypothetical predicted protein [Mytilus galloprovincialis]